MVLKSKELAVFLLVVLLEGCRTMEPVQAPAESVQDAQEALTAVAGAVAGKPLSDEELKNLEKQLRTDQEAQSAVQAITESVGGQAAVVKYCPVDGERYAPVLEECPIHHVKLEVVEP